MKAMFSTARMLTTALAAVGILAGFTADAFAANRTWTPQLNGPTAARWGTATIYATNWNLVSGTAVNPTAADTANFVGNNNRTVTPIANTLNIGQMVFSGTGSTTFSVVNGASIVISGSGSPAIGISTSADRGVFLNTKTVVNAPQLTVRNITSGTGLLTFGGGGLDINGNYLKGQGNIVQSSLGSSVSGASYEVVSGVQTLTFDAINGTNVTSLYITGGTASGDGTSSTNLYVQGGQWVGNGTFDHATSSAGWIDLSGGATLNTTDYTQTSGGSIVGSVYSDGSSSTVNGNFQLGGTYQLDASALGTSTFAPGTTWGLFSGINFTNGSASPANNASNFSVFAMSNESADSPYYGTFTKFGQEWYSPKASDGTYLVFQATSGNLVVVPEPSTIVFAGLGVAMSGWTMWKKRRLSKLLAAKAG